MRARFLASPRLAPAVFAFESPEQHQGRSGRALGTLGHALVIHLLATSPGKTAIDGVTFEASGAARFGDGAVANGAHGPGFTRANRPQRGGAKTLGARQFHKRELSKPRLLAGKDQGRNERKNARNEQ